MKLKDKNMVPPGGFGYMEPETGVHRDGKSLRKTVELVMEHRASNNLPRQSEAEASEDVERQICQRIPPQFCTDIHTSVIAPEIVTPRTLIAGALAIAHWLGAKLTGKDPFVNQETADKRAAICAKCFLNNRKVDVCTNCAVGDQLREAMGLTIGDRHTSRDGVMGSCRVCGCLNRVTVWFSADILNAVTPAQYQEKYKHVPFCWRGQL